MIETPLRRRVDLTLGWDFVRRRVGRRWLAGRPTELDERVELPHCWNAHDTFEIGRRSYAGRGAYRRRIELPPSPDDGRWRLRSGGFYGPTELWLDGRLLARVDAQYLGFDVELPPELEPGEHLLALRLDNRPHRNVLPGRKVVDFILHGGLAAEVWLERVPLPALDLERLAVTGRRLPDGGEVLRLDSGLAGDGGAPGQVLVTWTLRDGGGAVVGMAGPLPAGAAAEIVVPRPECWSPASPSLYRAELRLERDGATVDEARVRFGITRAEFRPDEGFFLDGRRTELRGANRHAEIPGLGSALPDELHHRDARILKDLGCNFVRLSHYPQSPAFLDACDELGILVYAELATWKVMRSSARFQRAAQRQLRSMVLRDRHHPSVILWGIGNETRARAPFLALSALARELDPSRPVTYAENHLYRARRYRTLGIPDVWSVNYELHELEAARDASRLRAVILTECCKHFTGIRGDDREELAQVAAVESDWEAMAGRPFLAGHAVWSFSDYATEYRRRFRGLSGLVDAWRRPKMAAELFRARYAEAPFVSLVVTAPGPPAPATRFRKEVPLGGGPADRGRELHVFTNCETVRLARGGAMVALLEGAIHYVLPVGADFGEVIATGSARGRIAQGSIRPHGPAQRIALTIPEGQAAPGRTVELDLTVLDAAGLRVADWRGQVRLAVEGRARLRTPGPRSLVEVARGEGRGYLTIGRRACEVMVTAHVDGLAPGSASLHFDESGALRAPARPSR
jgi:beta-galactosidase